jgi:hypothetical protein
MSNLNLNELLKGFQADDKLLKKKRKRAKEIANPSKFTFKKDIQQFTFTR